MAIWWALTARLAEVEAQQEEDNTSNDEGQADEIELLHVFPEGLPLVGVEA